LVLPIIKLLHFEQQPGVLSKTFSELKKEGKEDEEPHSIFDRIFCCGDDSSYGQRLFLPSTPTLDRISSLRDFLDG